MDQSDAVMAGAKAIFGAPARSRLDPHAGVYAAAPTDRPVFAGG